MALRPRKVSAQRGRSFRCSFCGKPQRDVQWLVAGERAYICDECVQLCTDSIGVASGPLDPTMVRLKCLSEALALWRHSTAGGMPLPDPVPEAVLTAAKVFSDFVLATPTSTGGAEPAPPPSTG